jgi:heptosyltransferase-1
MRVLIVKTSSMGDVIHSLPALTDAGKAIPGIKFDWIVEENFAEIPAWHPLVEKVIPIAWRRWRKKLFSKATMTEMGALLKNLRAEKYDLVLDAQGLVKSGFFSLFAKGKRSGLDWSSARESFASVFYNQKHTVSFQQHAVVRARSLFAKALGYALPETMADYGIDRNVLLAGTQPEDPYVVFLHGTTWITKHWPEEYWSELVAYANQAGYRVKLPWGSRPEFERANRIAAGSSQVEILPRLDLVGMAKVLAGAKAIAAVDTGLGHLAAALDVPTVSLYGPTNPALTGACGKSQVHLTATFPCAPCLSKGCTYVGDLPADAPSSLRSSSLNPRCFTTLTPGSVWGALSTLL